MNGYKTTIFEMHTMPGGLCTAWKRKGYTFDISMHMLVGSKSGPLNKMWQELGVLEGRKFFYHDETARIESGGKSLNICGDPRRLEDQMLALSPADADLTKEFIRLLSGQSIMRGASLKPAEMFSLVTTSKWRLFFSAPAGLQEIRADDASGVCATLPGPFSPKRRPVLHRFTRVADASLPMVAMAGFFKAFYDAGVPLGGSQQVIFRIAELYSGSEARFTTTVGPRMWSFE